MTGPWRLVAALLMLALAAPAPPGRPGQDLVKRLKILADSGRLADPVFVAATLHVRFNKRVATSPPYEDSATYEITCAPGLTKRATKLAFYTPDAATALHQTSYGVADMTRPGFGTINAQPSEIRGDPQLRYSTAERHDCTGYVGLSSETTAELQVGPVSTLDCISTSDLVGWLPEALQGYASDGAIVYHYQGTKSQITFEFFVGTPCMLGLRLEQEARLTPRYQAAQQRQRLCMLPHRVTFCRTHPPFGWSDGDVLSRMDSAAERECGTLDRFLARTPVAARPATLAPSEAGVDRSTPCSQAEASLARLGRAH